jgi:hypothetical protein
VVYGIRIAEFAVIVGSTDLVCWTYYKVAGVCSDRRGVVAWH